MTSILKQFIGAALLLGGILSAIAQTPDESASREHFFPLIADGGGFQSYLFVTNVSDAANQCTLALQGPDLDTGIFKANDSLAPAGASATIELAAGVGATLESTGESALTFGYAKLDCDQPAVARMLLTLKNSGDTLAITVLESANPGTSFQFPVLPGSGQLFMILSSAENLDAACSVELEDDAGASIGAGNVTVPANSTALQILDELIPIPNDLDAGTARLSCNQNIASLGLLRNGSVFTALPAIDLENNAKPSNTLPLILDGDGFRSQLLLTNLAETGNQCSINLRGAGLDASQFDTPDGAPATLSSVTLELGAKGDQASLLSPGANELSFGYATIECDEPAAALNLLTVSAAGSLAGMAAVSGAQPANGFRFPVVPNLARMALVLNNVAESDASCTVELSDIGDKTAPMGLVEIPGQSSAVRFLGDLLDVPDNFPGGTARLSCDGDVSTISLPLSGAVFAAMPPVIISTTESSNLTFARVVGGDHTVHTYTEETPIATLQLPEATGGSGELTYGLSPEVPGLHFDAATRVLTGTPSATGFYVVTYTATDADGDTVNHPPFTIAVMPGNQHYTVGTAIDALSLPLVIGGENVETIYGLQPRYVPGLNYNKATNRLTGIPSEAGAYEMRLVVQHPYLDHAFRFTINVTDAPYAPEILADADSSPIIFNENLFVLPAVEDLTQDEDGSVLTYATMEFYKHFNDEFDFLFIISNTENTPPRPYSLRGVRNDTLGIGKKVYDRGPTWGSDGYLKAVVDLPRYFSMTNGPSLHEVMHTWANFVVYGGFGRFGAHWGLTSANGILGGFNANDLIDHGDGRYTAGRFSNTGGGNSKPYSPIELYLAGFIPANDVPDLLVPENADWLRDEEGNRTFYYIERTAYPMFTAEDILRLSIEDIVAEAGERIPSFLEAQKDFRAAAILLIDDQHPASRPRLEFISETVTWFSHLAADEFDYSFNFYEATGGRGTMAMGELSRFKKASSDIQSVSSEASPELHLENPF